MNLRPSRLHLNVVCPPSALPPNVRIERPNPDSMPGTLTHDVLTVIGRGGQLDLDAIAHNRGAVNDAELQRMARFIAHTWDRIKPLFPEPQFEVRMELEDGDVTLAGTADLVSTAGHELRIMDLKSGWRPSSAEAQLRGYAVLALHSSDASTIRATQLNLRDGILDTWLWGREDVLAWWDNLKQLLREMVSAGATALLYHPGEHCRYCPRWHECPAGAMLVRAAGAYLVQLDAEAGDLLPEDLATILERARQVERAAEMARRLVTAAIDAAGGRIALADGRELRLVRQEVKKILYGPGQHVLADAIGPEALAECLTVGKTKVEDAIRATAGRGMKTAAVQDLMRRLDEAGAITTSVREFADITRTPAQIGVET